MKQIAAFFLLLSWTIPGSAQLQVSTSLTPQQLVEDVLLGEGVTVFNVTYNDVLNPLGDNPAIGSFAAENTELDLNSGIVLASGYVTNTPGPASGFMSDWLGINLASDPDLTTIAGVTINDKSVLEFDCTPVGDTLLIDYVFGSEEYPEWVCAFNDVFGFFLSGPGLLGPYSNGAVNIALVPGSNTPVGINTVNNGLLNDPNSPGCAAQNPDYFLDNELGQHVVFDGLTVGLTAFAVVQPGSTYHFKIGIGDALDTAFDSGVFLGSSSFRSSGMISTGIPETPPALGLEHHGDAVAILLPTGTQGELLLFGDTGQLIRSQRVDSDRVWLDLGGLPTGLYTVRVLDAQGLAPLRFVKG
ncbi:MAG: choice-of-anchor L domain-containing protein [Flavobacteriales bacterium]|nr:choice-of-anchor L domain-containing protein [Flavobacteriales bacterium]